MFTHKEGAETAMLTRRLMRHGEPYELEKRYVRKDGSMNWVNVSASPVRDMQGKVQSVVAVVVDITARKKAETELRRSKEMLETLVQRRTQALRAANAELKSEIERRKGLEGEILAVSDREQQRLGRELHDSLCQDLTAIGLMARSTALRLKNHRVVQIEDLEQIAQLISNSVIDARNIARDLHKEEMDAANFVSALHDLAERTIWSMPCQLKIATKFEIESDTVASELYRILREALMNANKHARATQTLIEVRHNKNELIFSVMDNGIGLRAKAKRGSGLGFHIMNYRAKSIGGRLEVGPLKTGGTRVSVYLPNGTDMPCQSHTSRSESR
jgi:signal transduction histidine kinase